MESCSLFSVKSFVSTAEVPRFQYRLCPAMHLSRLAQVSLRIVTGYCSHSHKDTIEVKSKNQMSFLHQSTSIRTCGKQ
jgi:hypothetical protein